MGELNWHHCIFLITLTKSLAQGHLKKNKKKQQQKKKKKKTEIKN